MSNKPKPPCLLSFSPSDCQVPEQPCQGAHDCRQQSQHAAGDDVWECEGRRALLRARVSLFLCNSSITHWVTAVSFRNVMPSASSSSWWRPDTLRWVNRTWSPSLSAHGIWVNSLLSCQTAADSLMSGIGGFSYRKGKWNLNVVLCTQVAPLLHAACRHGWRAVV